MGVGRRQGRHLGIGDSRGVGRGPMRTRSEMELRLSGGTRGQGQGMGVGWSSQCGGCGREELRLILRTIGSQGWF